MPRVALVSGGTRGIGALFLAAAEASFITGSTLSINGGQYMC